MRKDALSGGKNPPLTFNEKLLGKNMSVIFRSQYSQALERDVANQMKFDWLVDGEWNERIYRDTHEIITLEAVKGGKAGGKAIGVSTPDFIDRPQVKAALKTESYKFAQSVNQSTADKLRVSLIKGHDMGENIDELTKRIKAVFAVDDPDRAVSWRAERIARTETAQAYSVGQTAQWKESGLVKQTKWLASSNACPFCMAMDGEIVDIGDNFWEQGDEMEISWEEKVLALPFDYRSVQGPPLHPNCRCALIAVLVDIKR